MARREGREEMEGKDKVGEGGREGGRVGRKGGQGEESTDYDSEASVLLLLSVVYQPASQLGSQAATEPATIALPCHTGSLAGPPARVLMRFFLPARAAA